LREAESYVRYFMDICGIHEVGRLSQNSPVETRAYLTYPLYIIN
jgi:hypothetical protein